MLFIKRYLRWWGRGDSNLRTPGPEFRTEISPSDIEQEGALPRPNVHEVLASLQAFQVDTERHQVASSDPVRDGRVTTQTTTQGFDSLPDTR